VIEAVMAQAASEGVARPDALKPPAFDEIHR
jgi:hypothetical protein